MEVQPLPPNQEVTTNSNNTMTVKITTDGVPKVHCPICQKGLTTLTGYVCHVKKHSPPGGFLCRYCPAHYCSEEELQRHLASKHTATKEKIAAAKNSTPHDGKVKPKRGRPRKVPANSSHIVEETTTMTASTPTNMTAFEHRPILIDKMEAMCSDAEFIDCEPNETNFDSDSQETAAFSVHEFIKTENYLTHDQLRHHEPHATEIIMIKGEEMEVEQVEVTPDTDALELHELAPLHHQANGKAKKQQSRKRYTTAGPGDYAALDENASTQKRGPGRPRKNPDQLSISLTLSNGSSSGGEESKPRRGRPKGLSKQRSLAAPSPACTPAKRGRGRPRKIAEAAKTHTKTPPKATPTAADNPTFAVDRQCIKIEKPDRVDEDEAAIELSEDQQLTEAEATPAPRRRGRPRKDGNYSYPTAKKKKRVSRQSLKLLRERIRVAKGTKTQVWDCVHCKRPFHFRKSYEKHLRNIHSQTDVEIAEHFKDNSNWMVPINDDVHRCHICNKFYVMEWRLQSHLKRHGPEGNWIFQCPCLCARYFATDKEAIEHAHEQHRNQLFCEICQRFMNSRVSYKSHMEYTHGQQPKKREIAATTATTTTAAAKTNKPAGSGGVNLVCEKCGKKFKVRTRLNDHVRSDCGRNPSYECEVCGKKLTTAGILKTHMSLHQEETPFSCDKCGKGFKSKHSHKFHMKYRHSDAKPFKCHLCPKEYPYRESLFIHMTVHTGIKRFRCDGCNKRFSCISNLLSHRRAQADTCGRLPLNTKSMQYMGVQKGSLLLGAKPEAGLDYEETHTIVAKDVIMPDYPREYMGYIE